MLSAVLFGLSIQPNKLSPTLTQGGVRLTSGDYRAERHLDSRASTCLLPVDVFDDSPALGGFYSAANSSAVAGSWVELRGESTAARMEGAFGATTTRDGIAYDGIVIEIDVIIDVDYAATEDPGSQFAGTERWMEGPESNKAGTALTKLNNRIDQSRSRTRFKDRLRPI
jgi:hypothetical protein